MYRTTWAEKLILGTDSPHNWLEGRGPELCLIAIKMIFFLFVSSPAVFAYFVPSDIVIS
jgi:hypothetical protein